MKAHESRNKYWRVYISYSCRARREYDLSIPRLVWIGFRYYRRWKCYLKDDFSPLCARIPWIPFECQDYLKRILAPDFRIFEYGSGGSTLFFADRCAEVVSIEHDREWHEQVIGAIRSDNLTQCDCHLISPSEPDENLPAGLPTFVNYAGSGYPNRSFQRYVRSIEAFADETFDLVCVDGRARNSCIFHAKLKVRPGGYLLLDNSERATYAEGKQWMQDWTKKEFFGPLPGVRMFLQATIWRRPR